MELPNFESDDTDPQTYISRQVAERTCDFPDLLKLTNKQNSTIYTKGKSQKGTSTRAQNKGNTCSKVSSHQPNF